MEETGDRMQGQKVLITGVGKETGLGFEVARQCLQEGAQVWVSGRDAEVTERLAARLDAQALTLDITEPTSIATARDRMTAAGGLDILINNAAGTGPWGEDATAPDLSAVRAVMDVTLYGTWAMCAAFLPLLRASSAGRIVNVSSGAGSHGDSAFGLHTENAMGASYAVAKAALNALTVKLARAETAGGVKINAVCPGFTATFEGGAEMGARPVSEGAASIFWAARLDESGPTGGFFRDGALLAW